MTDSQLAILEAQASERDLLLRLQIRRPLNLWAFRMVVGKYLNSEQIQILGEVKGWAYHGSSGLQLDTMQVAANAPQGIGHLLWAAVMAWALEATPCKKARLLAIHDDAQQHRKLLKYFHRRGFQTVKEVGSAPLDLPLRVIWGGAGSLMLADCHKVLVHSKQLWGLSC